VSLNVGAEQEAAYPRRFGARLHVRTKGNKAMTSQVVHVLGDPENPLHPEQVEAKAIDLLLASGWTRQRAETLVSACRHLPYQETLDPLWHCLTDKD
jgi:2-methylcitrate dehydratase PrpD